MIMWNRFNIDRKNETAIFTHLINLTGPLVPESIVPNMVECFSTSRKAAILCSPRLELSMMVLERQKDGRLLTWIS